MIQALALGICLPLAGAAGTPVSFVRDIVPVLTKAGCANSNCHGSIRGRSGFKLSLFGYDPDLDFEAITRANKGRRISRTMPEKSLLLLKPTLQIPHGGGVRSQKDFTEYATLLSWLRQGAAFDQPGSPHITSLQVSPDKLTLHRLGSRAQLTARATYSDGSQEDVTRKVQYSANDPSVVEIDPGGQIQTLRGGETPIMVRMLGKATVARVEVVDRPTIGNYPEVAPSNFIDELVLRKL